MEGAFYFSQIYTEEQNTQHSTETLSQPISQNLTANVSWKASVNSVCRRPSVCSKPCAKRLSELCALCERKNLPRLREKTPQQLAWVLSYREDAFYFSQSNTEEQKTQRSTETLSQPISQNLTPIFSSNALWTLYAGGLLWARNCAQKCSVNSVRSVREKTSPASLIGLISSSGCVLFLTDLHRWTEHTGGRKIAAPPPSPAGPSPVPSPRREGEWSPRYPYGLDVGCFLPPYWYLHWQ